MATVDAIVIGGGIVGSCVAHELARHGMRCIVLERAAAVGSEASGAAAGMLGAQAGPPPAPLFDLLIEAQRRWQPLLRGLQEHTGVDLEVVPSPGLQLVGSEAELKKADRIAAAHRARGLEAQVLRAPEVQRREPALDPKRFKGALLFGGEHHLSAPAATQALARAAELRGARFVFGAAVTAIDRPARRRFVVRTTAGDFEAPWVVDAAGAWAGEVAALVGLKVPVEPVRGQVFRTAPRPPIVRSAVYGETIYLLQKQAGHVLVGATFERVGFDKRVVPEAIARLHKAAVELVPALSGVVVQQSWAGLRPGTPDDLPILDAPTKVPGFVIASGHCRNGILLGPLTGEIVAALVVGDKPPVPLKPYALSRFGR